MPDPDPNSPNSPNSLPVRVHPAGRSGWEAVVDDERHRDLKGRGTTPDEALADLGAAASSAGVPLGRLQMPSSAPPAIPRP
jgi:hypothetical protein